jgi:hypothetical protein
MPNRKFVVIRNSSDIAATRDDIQHILGDIDQLRMIGILSLSPTVYDLERAAAWLVTNPDNFANGRLKAKAGSIVDVITDGEVAILSVGPTVQAG